MVKNFLKPVLIGTLFYLVFYSLVTTILEELLGIFSVYRGGHLLIFIENALLVGGIFLTRQLFLKEEKYYSYAIVFAIAFSLAFLFAPFGKINVLYITSLVSDTVILPISYILIITLFIWKGFLEGSKYLWFIIAFIFTMLFAYVYIADYYSSMIINVLIIFVLILYLIFHASYY